MTSTVREPRVVRRVGLDRRRSRRSPTASSAATAVVRLDPGERHRDAPPAGTVTVVGSASGVGPQHQRHRSPSAAVSPLASAISAMTSIGRVVERLRRCLNRGDHKILAAAARSWSRRSCTSVRASGVPVGQHGAHDRYLARPGRGRRSATPPGVPTPPLKFWTSSFDPSTAKVLAGGSSIRSDWRRQPSAPRRRRLNSDVRPPRGPVSDRMSSV